MDNKRVLITGARNKWSIAWHCALSVIREGGQVAFSCYSERESEDVKKLLASADLADCPRFVCDVTDQAQIDQLFAQVGEAFDGSLDGLLHGIAFAKREELAGEFLATTQEGFRIALDTSCYSLVSLTRGARPLMQAAGGGSVITLTYLGGERVVQNYNVMGVAKAALECSVRYLAADLGQEAIRVNAISAGPIKTLAASGISHFSALLAQFSERAPMRRTIEAGEVGDTAAYLFSDLARGVTGEVVHVDAGYHAMGM